MTSLSLTAPRAGKGDLLTTDAAVVLSDEELDRRLASALTVTARGLYETAILFAEKQRRGHDVDRLRLSLAPYLPRIARGELAAEAVIAFAGFRTALDRVALLPIERQRAVAAGEELRVVRRLTPDAFAVAARPLSVMSASEVRSVISPDGRILPPEAQEEHLRKAERSSGGPRRKSTPRGRQPNVVHEGDHVRIGRQAVRVDHLIRQLHLLGVIP